jgi:hypothetical protein
MYESQFRKGDPVRFRLGTRFAQGEIKEDRGPIGIKGRHLFLVEFRPEPDSNSHSLIELPADQLESVCDTISIK